MVVPKTQDLETITDDFQDTFKFIMENIFGPKSSFISTDSKSNNKTNFDEIKDEIPKEWDRLRKVLFYNAPQGKQLRGRLVVRAYQGLVPDASENNLKLANLLGWSLEILQAAYLVADDIMDNGHLRRGQPCWHQLDTIGLTAINDIFLLENCAYQIIHKYFNHLSCYTPILDLLSGITFKTLLGQSLDLHSSTSATKITTNTGNPFKNYNDKLYFSIVRYKTSYYTTYLPIALSMTLAGISKNEAVSLWKNVEAVTLEIGHLFQVQDDYLDCFGDEQVIGKIGSDIQEGKCTWLFVTAMEVISSKMEETPEKKTLINNYGKKDPKNVETVKQLYLKLKLPKHFEVYRNQMEMKIRNMISNLNHPGLEAVIFAFFDKIVNRNF